MSEGGVRPWHLWAVGLLGLLWNGFGATDFAMTFIDREMWFATMGVTAEQAARMDAMPAWTYGAWLAGTWGAFLERSLCCSGRAGPSICSGSR